MSLKIGNKPSSFIKYELPQRAESASTPVSQKLPQRSLGDAFDRSGAQPVPSKTLAIPEEGGKIGGSVTVPSKTLAIPEEGGKIGGSVTVPGKTLAIPEEGGKIGGSVTVPGKTLAIPEEGGKIGGGRA